MHVKNANGTAFVTTKKKKLNWKESVAAQKKKIVTYINAEEDNFNFIIISFWSSILTQKRKIVTYTFTQFFKWNHDLSFLSNCYIFEEEKIKAEEENCVTNAVSNG